MQNPIIQSVGNINREVGEVKVVAFFEPGSGKIVHMHTVVTIKGGRSTSEEEAIQQGLRLAERAGIQTAHLARKVSSNHDHALQPHRIDIESCEFVRVPSR